MRVIEYRGVPLVDREKEEKYLLEKIEEKPSNILFVYGPKSSGKTTLIEYIVEEKLQKEPKKYYVNYVNFRRYSIHSYDSFLNVYFQPIEDENKPWVAKALERFPVKFGRVKGEISLPYEGIQIALNYELFEKIREREVDPFDVFFETIKNINKKRKVILIIDEVQELSDIYMNGELQKKYLLTEFFKFLVSLTKETHLAHIVVSTSSSIFIDEIYNNSKLAETSEFYLIDYFDYEISKEWLEMENFNEEEIKLIWEYFGGSPFRLKMVIDDKKMGNIEVMEEYLKEHASIIADKIGLTISNDLNTLEEREYFEKLLIEMLSNGCVKKDSKDDLQKKVLNVGVEKDFLFIRKGKIVFNSAIMKKGAEVYVNERIC